MFNNHFGALGASCIILIALNRFRRSWFYCFLISFGFAGGGQGQWQQPKSQASGFWDDDNHKSISIAQPLRNSKKAVHINSNIKIYIYINTYICIWLNDFFGLSYFSQPQSVALISTWIRFFAHFHTCDFKTPCFQILLDILYIVYIHDAYIFILFIPVYIRCWLTG